MTVMLALTAAVNASGGNFEKKFAYNHEVENGQVTAQYVYRVEGRLLKQHLKYNFTYDVQGRILRKEARRWDATAQDYRPGFCLDMTYVGDEKEVTYALWDEQTGSYSDLHTRAVYLTDGEHVTYQAYEWDGDERSWILQQSMHTGGVEVQLLAVGD